MNLLTTGGAPSSLTLPDKPLLHRINPLVEGPTWRHAVWAGDPFWTGRPSDGTATASIRNQSGGGDPANSTAANRPTYRANVAAFNGYPGLEFDGVNDVLYFDIADKAVPWYVVAIGSYINGANSAKEWMVASGSNSADCVIGKSAANQWKAAANAAGVSLGTPDTSPHLFVAKCATGSTGYFSVDNAAPTAGPVGADNLNTIAVGAGVSWFISATGFFRGFWNFAGWCDNDPMTDSHWPTIIALAKAVGCPV